MEPLLSIEEVAKRTGLSAHTLRYYERIGLIAGVGRAPGGQRRYAASDMAWIEFLLRLRTTHMPIAQMLVFAQLRGVGDATVAARRQMLEAHLHEVEADIAAKQQTAAVLRAKIAHYLAHGQSLTPNETLDEKGHDHGQQRPLPTRAGKTARN
jgi:DNA-binding transcriptional MerR regulator